MKIKELVDRLLANWPPKVLSIAAAILLLVFNRMNNLQEINVEVPLEVILPEGFAISTPYQDKVSITVKGQDAEVISRIRPADYRVFTDLSEISQEGEALSSVRYTRRGPALSSDVFIKQVEPTEVSIMLEKEIRKVLSVQPKLRGTPAPGYTLAGYEIYPAMIELKGPRSKIEAISRLSTGEIEISGKSNNFTVRIKLQQLDPLIHVLGDTSVEFNGNIEEIIVTRMFTDIPIKGLNMNPSLEWLEDTSPGRITLQGPQLLMEGLDTGDILMAADLTGINMPGEYVVPVNTTVPSRMEIREYGPKAITITLLPKTKEER